MVRDDLTNFGGRNIWPGWSGVTDVHVYAQMTETRPNVESAHLQISWSWRVTPSVIYRDKHFHHEIFRDEEFFSFDKKKPFAVRKSAKQSTKRRTKKKKGRKKKTASTYRTYKGTNYTHTLYNILYTILPVTRIQDNQVLLVDEYVFLILLIFITISSSSSSPHLFNISISSYFLNWRSN